MASFRASLGTRPLVADGAMGTMLQAAGLTTADFTTCWDGPLVAEGCNELLNQTRPDLVAQIHDAYLEVGVDLISTNTFGANESNLGDYGLASQVGQLAELGAQIARERADLWSSRTGQPRWVLGSLGPGTQLPSLGHTTYQRVRHTTSEAVAGLLAGGVDAILLETVQDPLQAKAAVTGARDAMGARQVPLLVTVTLEATGTMLVGTQLGAALVALQALQVDGFGLNCATGPEQMTQPLRYLAQHAPMPLVCQPNAGLPILDATGAHYPLTPTQLAQALSGLVAEGLAVVGGCCGTTPEHLAAVVDAVRPLRLHNRKVERISGLASLYEPVPWPATTPLLIGERTNANGSRAFRDALLAADLNQVANLARTQADAGAQALDVCVDYVGRDAVSDMSAVAATLATASPVPLMVDSTDPAAIRAGLEFLGGRAVANSVTLANGTAPGTPFAETMAAVVEHGAAVVGLAIDEQGQARTAERKVAVAVRMIEAARREWGLRVEDLVIDPLTFPITTGQAEMRGEALETLTAIRDLKGRYPNIHITLGISNVSFGLAPPARQVLNTVFLHEAVAAGLDCAILNPAKLLRRSQIADERWYAALDLIWNRHPEALTQFIELFAASQAPPATRENLAEMPQSDQLFDRVITGNRADLASIIEAALSSGVPARTLLSESLLPAMAEVGRRFGVGEAHLPAVLQSAETMRTAVERLRPALAATGAEDAPGSRGTIVLATVRGDVHDIGKNLVDIVLSSNGYRVINLGTGQPISAVIDAAITHDADVIGLSGLLVKSTEVMREDLAELTARGLAGRWPVILGGAALNRRYVEEDLAAAFPGVVRYAADAFEGLALMAPLVAVARRGAPPPPSSRRSAVVTPREPEPSAVTVTPRDPEMSAVTQAARTPDDPAPAHSARLTAPAPRPPFWGTRVLSEVPLARFAELLDEKALFSRWWGLRGATLVPGEPEHHAAQAQVARMLEQIERDHLLDPASVYGYFPAWSLENQVVVLEPPGGGTVRFTFPRQDRPPYRCLADHILGADEVAALGEPDLLPIQLVTLGTSSSHSTQALHEAGAYREYAQLHGLFAGLTEALAEHCHREIRAELGLAPGFGARYSFGYPACPDLAQRRGIVQLLRPERIGVQLTQGDMLEPELSTDALVFPHCGTQQSSA